MNKDTFKGIRNPLSVIVVFAGIIEVALTVTLIKLPVESQDIFIWFVMFTTILLIGSFFYVLYKKPAVLFSPSDYEDESKYLDSIGEARDIQKLNSRTDQLEQVSNSIINYLDALAENIEQNAPNTLIKEKRKLEELKNFRIADENTLYRFLSKELMFSHDTIRKIIFQTKEIEQLETAALETTGNQKIADRIKRTVESFPKVAIDYKKLRDYFTETEV